MARAETTNDIAVDVLVAVKRHARTADAYRAIRGRSQGYGFSRESEWHAFLQCNLTSSATLGAGAEVVLEGIPGEGVEDVVGFEPGAAGDLDPVVEIVELFGAMGVGADDYFYAEFLGAPGRVLVDV